MKFIGALIWAFSDPDRKRNFELFSPMAGTASLYPWTVSVMRVFCLFFMVGLWNYTFQRQHYYDIPHFGNALFLVLAFLKACVGLVTDARKLRNGILKESLSIVVAVGLMCFLTRNFL